MEKKDILETAIQKSIAGGWRGDLLDIKVKQQYDGLPRVYWDDTEWSVKDILYNHAFARGLWGDGEHHQPYFGTDGYGTCDKDCDITDPDIKYCWQGYVRDMVIADDPIKYLGEHMK